MKIKVRAWCPVRSTKKRTGTIEIPDDVDVDEYVYVNNRELIEKFLGEKVTDAAVEVGFAGLEIVKERP